jgi:LmbE family N-acetylglucosaminyl deacetylase
MRGMTGMAAPGKTYLFILCAQVFLMIIASMAVSESNFKQTAMYVLAHEDDEIDVAAKIATDLREGKRVYAVWVTKGDKGGDPATREKEARAAMDFVGLRSEYLIFMGYPDQESYRHIGQIVRDLTEIATKIKPAEIMSHAYEGGNIDHDTVSFTSTMVAKKLGIKHFDFPDTSMYQGKINVWKFLPDQNTPVLYTKLDKELFNMKMKLIHMYPSQASGLNAYELLTDKKQLREYGEPYRVAPDYDYTKPPSAETRYASTSKGTADISMFIDAINEYMKNENNQ